MVRIHRSLIKRAKKIDVEKVANDAEDYVYGAGLFRRELMGLTGLTGPSRIKTAVKRIDDFEKEMQKLEDKIDKLEERKCIEAAKLEETLEDNDAILRDYLTPDELSEFWG